MSTVLALAAIAVAVALSVVRSVQERRLRKRLDDRDKVVDRTIGDLRATMREYAGDVNQIYEWAQSWAAEDEQADRRADDQSPVVPNDQPADAITGQGAQHGRHLPDPGQPEEPPGMPLIGSDAQADADAVDWGEPVEAEIIDDDVEEPPATSEAWPPPTDDPPTTEIPRIGAHRTEQRATRSAGRALREGADEETTR